MRGRTRAHAKVVRELIFVGKPQWKLCWTWTEFIDAAVMAGVHQLSIIHGKGTGVLRAAVQQHLKTPISEELSFGRVWRRQSGVTIVELK